MKDFAGQLTDLIRSYPELTAAVLSLIGWLVALVAWVTILWKRSGALRKAVRWVKDHLVQVVSLLALPVLVLALVWSYFDSQSKPHHQLILLGLVLAAAVLGQFGNDLLARLKKIGPIEFAEQRFEEIFPELEGLALDVKYHTEVLSDKLIYECEKADVYLTQIEGSGLLNQMTGSEKLYNLLLSIGKVALYTGNWLRAADRLELLLKTSGGKFRAAEAHYRCGLAYTYWAESTKDRARNEAFLKAHEHLWKATREDPHHGLAYFNLAYVQHDLKRYELALRNNERVLELERGYGPAKYNIAVCHIDLEDMDAALEALTSLKVNDELVKDLVEMAFTDPDMGPLLGHPSRGPEARRFLRSLAGQVQRLTPPG